MDDDIANLDFADSKNGINLDRVRDVVLNYLTEKYGSADEQRFKFKYSPPESEGKYSRVVCVTVTDDRSKGISHLVVKRNRGRSSEDSMAATTIEAKILSAFHEKKMPVPEVEYVEGDYLITSFVNGPSLDKYLSEEKSLHPTTVFKLMDSMFEIQEKLEEMIESVNGGLSDAEKSFLKQRYLNLIQDAFSEVPIEGIAKNQYSFKILKEMEYGPTEQFLLDYAQINDSLLNAPRTWISFDHPRNRIVYPKDSENPGIVRYDFNHLEPGFWGLDLALSLSALGFSDQKNINRTIGTYTNVAILRAYCNRHYNDSEIDDSDARDVLHEIQENTRKKGISREYSISIMPLLKHSDMLVDSACIYSAFMHRTMISLVRTVNEIKQWSVQEIELVDRYMGLLDNIDQLALNLYNGLDHGQRNILNEHGITLPLSYERIAKHIDAYIKESSNQ